MKALLCLSVLALGACQAAPSPMMSMAPIRPAASSRPASFERSLLAVHNAERARVGAAPVSWDPALAASAAAYARRIAPLRRLVHSAKAERPGAGENLWMGTRDAFAVETMAGMWAAEKRYFRPGLFPRNSSTGNWADVGHYTAMIWPTTTRIGCGLGVAGDNEVLVCRYSPSGNIDGRRVP